MGGLICGRGGREPALEKIETRAMDERGRDRGWNCPHRKVERLDQYAVLLQEAAHEQDRADGDEDVFAEKVADVLRGTGLRADALARLGGQGTELRFRRGFRHRRDQRAHHLRLSAERDETECDCDLAREHVEREYTKRGHRLEARDEAAR